MDPVSSLIALVEGRRTFVLVGAGCSTESGIPDYRGPETRDRARNPVQFRAFVADPVARRRYWARAYLGWPAMARARPNAAHHALAELERLGLIPGLVTQNVDGLHTAAGSERVIELHGALRDVVCLGCSARFPRDEVQAWMAAANPGFAVTVELAPDGDAEMAGTDGFAAPACPRCGGDLKPDVVFFGENVPPARVEAAYQWLAESERVLVVGSSLTVFSGYRFVKRAHERGLPIGLVNLGESRGDPLAAVRVDARAGDVLPRLVAALGGSKGVRMAENEWVANADRTLWQRVDGWVVRRSGAGWSAHRPPERPTWTEVVLTTTSATAEDAMNEVDRLDPRA